MPNLGGLPALDVAIGFVALFFLLSTVCSAINEGIANVLGWRAKTLEDAIRNLVGDPPVKAGLGKLIAGGWKRIGKLPKPQTEQQSRKAGKEATPAQGDAAAKPQGDASAKPKPEVTPKLFDHWRIKGLVRDPDSSLRRRARPSYLPPRAFSLALAETLAEGLEKVGAKKDQSPSEKGKSLWEQTDDEILEGVTAALKEWPPGQLRSLAQKAATNADASLEGFRVQVERVFDDSMERASGWYKRKVQSALLLLAAIVTIGLNIDTVRVANVLWNDQPLRTAVATRAAAQGTPEDAATAVDDIAQLKLPVGWGDNAPENVLYAIPGWLITIAALNLGAPFWFDLLSRLSRLRGAGVSERPRSLSDTPGTVEAERAERREGASVEAQPASTSDRTAADEGTAADPREEADEVARDPRSEPGSTSSAREG